MSDRRRALCAKADVRLDHNDPASELPHPVREPHRGRTVEVVQDAEALRTSRISGFRVAMSWARACRDRRRAYIAAGAAGLP
jgi:hypothetical protein